MAAPIVAEPLAPSQPLPVELEDVLNEAADNNVDLVTAFVGIGRDIQDQWGSFVAAVNQAVELGLLDVDVGRKILEAYTHSVYTVTTVSGSAFSDMTGGLPGGERGG